MAGFAPLFKKWIFLKVDIYEEKTG